MCRHFYLINPVSWCNPGYSILLERVNTGVFSGDRFLFLHYLRLVLSSRTKLVKKKVTSTVMQSDVKLSTLEVSSLLIISPSFFCTLSFIVVSSSTEKIFVSETSKTSPLSHDCSSPVLT